MLSRSFACLVLLAAYSLGFDSAALAQDAGQQIRNVIRDLDTDRAIIIDVREKDEWDKGHLAAASLVPLSGLEKDAGQFNLPRRGRDTIVYCYCRSGGRARVAARILQRLEYDARPIVIGYQDLVDAGFKKAK